MSSTTQTTRSYPTGLKPITPASTWADDDTTHPGFVIHGTDANPGHKAYYIHLEALPGKEDAVAAFLRDINRGVLQEPGTGPWFGMRYSQRTFAIFEAFSGLANRAAHDDGPGGRNFFRVDALRDMLAYPAQIHRLDVLHGKGVFGQDQLPLPEP